MALRSQHEDGPSPRRAGVSTFFHPLALAVLATIAVLAALVVAIALFGRPPAQPLARITLTLAPAAVAPVAPSPPPAAIQPPPSTAVSLPPQPTAPVYAGTALIADPALIESTSEGPLPRIAADGRTPLAAYAPPIGAGRGIKIAIVIMGLGLDGRATKAAIDELPPAVTLAFTPYGARLDHWLRLARRKGHEVLLEVPMEPRNFPDSDAGPHSLRPNLSADDNLARLKWALTRATGYVGITNLMGGRFLAEPLALEPVLSFLAARGLMFFDNSSGALAQNVALQLKAPYVRSDLRLDRVAAPAAIDQRLTKLENLARHAGEAVATGSLYPVTLSHVAAWARGLRGQGFVLVPASSIVKAKP
jgi:polysaccharide deacetylase 2 family uncharacterized protein YibQ